MNSTLFDMHIIHSVTAADIDVLFDEIDLMNYPASADFLSLQKLADVIAGPVTSYSAGKLIYSSLVGTSIIVYICILYIYAYIRY